MANRRRSRSNYTDLQRQLRDEDPELYFEGLLKQSSRDLTLVDLDIALFNPKVNEWSELMVLVEETVARARQERGLEGEAPIDFGKASGPEHEVLKETCKALQQYLTLSRLRPQAKEKEKLYYQTRLPDDLAFWINVEIKKNYAASSRGEGSRKRKSDTEQDGETPLDQDRVTKSKDDQRTDVDCNSTWPHHWVHPDISTRSSADRTPQPRPTTPAFKANPATPVPELRVLVASNLSCLLRVKFAFAFGMSPAEISPDKMTIQSIAAILKSIGYNDAPELVFVFEDGDNTKIPNDLVLRSAFENWRSEETTRFFSLYIDNRPGESWSRPPLPHPDQRTGMRAQGVGQEI
ncbi:hypothetical protein LTS17_010220 [Exophiala oligosperma]